MTKKAFFIVLSLVVTLAFVGAFSLINSLGSSKAVPMAKAVLSSHPCSYRGIGEYQLSCYRYRNRFGFELELAVFRKLGQQDPKEALIFLPGGPGLGGNTQYDSLKAWDFWLLGANLKQDLIVFDYMALSPSKPSWYCSHYERLSKDLLQESLSITEEQFILEPILAECYRQFSLYLDKLELPGPELINSWQNASDANAIGRELGYKQLIPMAVSYGARVGHLMLSSDMVEKAIFDSPSSFAQELYADSASDQTEAVLSLWCDLEASRFDECMLRKEVKTFFKILSNLKQYPVTIRSNNWQGYQQDSWLLNDHRFVYAVLSALYIPSLRQELMDLVEDYSIQELKDSVFLEYFYNVAFDENFNAFIYLLTQCNDRKLALQLKDVDTFGVVTGKTLADTNKTVQVNDKHSRADLLHTLGPQGEILRSYFKSNNGCSFIQNQQGESQSTFSSQQVLAKSEDDKQLKLKVGGSAEKQGYDKSILIASGRLDPITPLKYAKQLQGRFTNSRWIVLEDLGHGQFFQSNCGAELMQEFLEELAAEISDESGEVSRHSKINKSRVSFQSCN